MALKLQGRSIEKIGVVGSGNIGPDIALHFATAAGPHGVQVVVVDVAEPALEAGEKKAHAKVDKLVKKGRMKEAKAEAIKGALRFTIDYDALADAEIVVEAASEDLAVKHEIYAQLEQILAPDAVLASNTSHLEPEGLFDILVHPERALVAHYFFPAERNPIVELVSSAQTADKALRFLEAFYEETGKIPIRLGSRYGFAVNPVFEGMFLAAALLVEEGVATPEQVDTVACDALGYGIGPFTAMNLTGGNPLTAAALPHYGERVMPWFHTPRSLQEKVDRGEAWPMAERGAEVEVPEETRRRVSDALLGAYFGLVSEIADSGIIDVGSLELAVSTALSVTAPFALMNELGVAKALALVEAYAEHHAGFRVAALLSQQAEKGQPWTVPVVYRRDEGDVAVITLRRPQALNALNTDVFDQLEEHLEAVGASTAHVGAVITGFGPKAFAAGADIKELVQIPDAQGLEAKSRRGSQIFRKLETLGKPVVAAMNGLAFGGGLELAMACTSRIARAGQPVLAGQPEPKLGVIPGYGGTQRLPRLVGLAEAWPLLRTGEPISSARALELGLIDQEVDPSTLLQTALERCRALARGELEPPAKPEGPIQIPEGLPEVDLGHLSTQIDEIQREVILEGARTTLAEGLEIESRAFGVCFETEDFHIGMKSFLEKGAKSKAEFVHR